MKNREDLGLPEAPEGHFWRVTKRRHPLGVAVMLQLRRRTWYGSRLVAEDFLATGIEGDFILGYSPVAASVLRKVKQQQQEDAQVGDYE